MNDGRKHNLKGRSTGVPASSRKRKANRPPEGEPWVWQTRAILESPAFSVLPASARKIYDRIRIELMHQGGLRNGELPVTYNDFVKYGIDRRQIRPSLEMLEKLGLIDVTVRGCLRSNGEKCPSKYGLTHLPRGDGLSASNRWKKIKSIDQAKTIVRDCRRRKARGS